MRMDEIKVPMDLDGPGCYVWRHDVADRAIWELTGNHGLHVLKVGYSTNVAFRADEGALGQPTLRSQGSYKPYVYASLPGWKPWRCAKWTEQETLKEQEGRLSEHLKAPTDEQRAAIYARVSPGITRIPAGTEIFLGSLADLAALFPYCALTGEWKRAVYGPIQNVEKVGLKVPRGR
ncbi:hypothetical protein FHT02_000640 [Sphingomonas xinjiangensis]|uniref:Uncharacterized protein n=1 Tax=Sphingomonas xinjiangensis TaxID=643568 RepID=A0A840Y9B7_9SPHN|nr:hypothetical protein [Sphingomonas xinjiangensis]